MTRDRGRQVAVVVGQHGVVHNGDELGLLKRISGRPVLPLIHVVLDLPLELAVDMRVFGQERLDNLVLQAGELLLLLLEDGKSVVFPVGGAKHSRALEAHDDCRAGGGIFLRLLELGDALALEISLARCAERRAARGREGRAKAVVLDSAESRGPLALLAVPEQGNKSQRLLLRHTTRMAFEVEIERDIF